MSSLHDSVVDRGFKVVKKPFSMEMDEPCTKAYVAKNGKAPTTRSGTDCLPDGWTWNAVLRIVADDHLNGWGIRMRDGTEWT